MSPTRSCARSHECVRCASGGFPSCPHWTVVFFHKADFSCVCLLGQMSKFLSFSGGGFVSPLKTEIGRRRVCFLGIHVDKLHIHWLSPVTLSHLQGHKPCVPSDGEGPERWGRLDQVQELSLTRRANTRFGEGMDGIELHLGSWEPCHLLLSPSRWPRP